MTSPFTGQGMKLKATLLVAFGILIGLGMGLVGSSYAQSLNVKDMSNFGDYKNTKEIYSKMTEGEFRQTLMQKIDMIYNKK